LACISFASGLPTLDEANMPMGFCAELLAVSVRESFLTKSIKPEALVVYSRVLWDRGRGLGAFSLGSFIVFIKKRVS